MKYTKAITLVFLLLFKCSLFAQVSIEDANYSEYYSNTPPPVVTIRVLNMSEYEREMLTITYSMVTPLLRDKAQIKKTAHLSEESTCSLDIDYPFPNQKIWLRVEGLFYSGIYVNSNLSIVLDADSLKSDSYKTRKNGVQFIGSDTELNAILSKHLGYKRKSSLSIKKQVSLLMRDEDIEYADFITQYDSLYTLLHAMDDEFIEKYPSNYSYLIKNERYSKYYGDLCVKHWRASMDDTLLEKVKNHMVYLSSNSGAGLQRYFYIYLSSGSDALIDYSQFYADGYLDSNGRETLDSLLFYRAKTIVNYPDLCTSNHVMDSDYKTFHNLRNKMNRILGDSIVLLAETNYLMDLFDELFTPSKADFYKIKMISDREPAEKKIMIPLLLDNMTQAWCKELILLENAQNDIKLNEINDILRKAESQKLIIPLAKSGSAHDGLGEHLVTLPFGAELYKVDTLDAKQLLINLKATHRNKALVLDFWATWCGPCLADLPFSRDLHHELIDEPVEFVYICTSRGSSLEKWKAKIIELQLGGIHLFVDDGIGAELMELFSLSGYPSYVFIDTKGVYKADAIHRFSHTKKHDILKLMDK